jgi:transglutaminase-like putative cysteine protease
LRHNVKYDSENVPSGAAATAKLGRGVCQQFAELFIALCRAKGLPARYVSGLNTYFDERNPNSTSRHGWAEVFVSGLDWVPFDPTWMASTSDIEKPIHICLAKMRNNLALGISSNFQW